MFNVVFSLDVELVNGPGDVCRILLLFCAITDTVVVPFMNQNFTLNYNFHYSC